MRPSEEFLAKIPLTELTIKTTIPSYSVIERIEYGIKPFLVKRQGGEFYTFEGAYYGSHFKIQSKYRKSNGEDAFPNGFLLSIPLFAAWIKMETSPVFYGRVIEESKGATIKGHFGIPFPIGALLAALILLLAGKLYPIISGYTNTLSVFLIAASLFSLTEFITERKGTIDFMKGLFYDVIRQD